MRLRPSSRACSAVRQPSCTVAPDRASSVATAVPQLPAPTTTAWRIGCRPPSHSHCSEMHDHTRLEISCAAAWRGSRSSGRGKRQRAAAADGHAARADAPAAADVLGARGSRPGRSGRRSRAPAGRRRASARRAGRGARACPRGRCRPRRRARGSRARSPSPPRRTRRAGSGRRRAPAGSRPSSACRTARSSRRSAAGARGSTRSGTGRRSCGGSRRAAPGPSLGMCSRPDPPQPEVDVEEGLQDRAHDPVDGHDGPAFAGDLVGALEIHRRQ